MAYISYDKLWRSEFYNNVSANNTLQDLNINELKLKVNESYEKDEKLTTKQEALIDADNINKESLDTKVAEAKGQITNREKKL